MKKTEILEKIKNNVVKIIKDLPSREVCQGMTEYGLEVVITVPGGSQVNTQNFYVIDEGLPTESASFRDGREVKNFELQEPSRQKKLLGILNNLKAAGAVKAIDLSKLEISYALLQINGVKTFVAELDGKIIQLEAA